MVCKEATATGPILELWVQYRSKYLKNPRNEFIHPKSHRNHKLHIPSSQNLPFNKKYSRNIRGITDKLENKQLCEYICQHDIVCLVESMLDSQKTIHFSSYTVYNFARQVRHKKAKRCSGGIAISVVNRLTKHVKIKKVNECLVWITFKSSVNTNTKKRIMIGVVYVPPIDSSYNGIKQDIFDIIELEYSKCAIMIFFFVGISMPAQAPYRIL